MDDFAIVLGKGGFALFTLGLLLGVLIPKFRNPRMGLSAHLTSVQTGTALLVFALFWQFLGIPEPWSPLLSYSLLASSLTLVTGLVLAAFFGASSILPIAGKGFAATKVEERIVAVLVLSSSLVMLAASVAICFFMIVA